MARRRHSDGFHRREHEARERRRQRLIVLIAGSVLGVSIVLIVVGLLFTVILPPRASALVVDDQTINARQVAERAKTLDVFEGLRGFVTSGEVVDRAIERLIRDAALERAASGLIEEIEEDDLRAVTRQRLGMPDTLSDEQFDAAYRGFLESSGLSVSDVDDLLRGEAMRDRLREHLEEEVGESGPQVRTYSVRSGDEGRVAELRDRVEEGEDFAMVAVELELAGGADEVDQGWRPEEALNETVSAAIEGLRPGELSGVVHDQDGSQFVVYLVAERDEDREYDDAMREQVAQARLTRLVDEEREAMEVRVELADRARDWVVRQVQQAR